MGILGKRRGSGSVDIIDLTLLQRRGLLKTQSRVRAVPDIVDVEVFDKPRTSVRGTLRASKKRAPLQTAAFEPQRAHRFFDFTALSSTHQVSQNSSAVGPFGLMDTLAQSASLSPSEASNRGSESAELDALKIKIDDLEYKLDRLLERLTHFDSRLEGLESK